MDQAAVGLQLAGQPAELAEQGQGVLHGEIVPRRGDDLGLPDREGLDLSGERGVADDPVGQEGRAEGQGLGGRDAERRLDGGELLGNRVLPEQAELVFALDEGEDVLVAHEPLPDLGELFAVELERHAPVELVDGLPPGVGDDAVDVERGPVEAFEALDAQPGRLDQEVDEGPAGGVPGDLDEGVALDVVGRVLDLDEVLVLEEPLRVADLDALVAHLGDLLVDEDVGRRSRVRPVNVFAGDERHRDVRDLRLALPQLPPGLDIVGHVAVVHGHELLGAVPDRGIEDVVARVVLLEEHDVEGAGQVRAGRGPGRTR